MLKSSEVIEQYEKVFAIVEVEFNNRQRWGEVDANERRPEVDRYNPEQLRPVMVVLDAEGKRVFKSFGGFKNPKTARLLGEYVGGRHYRNTGWKEFISFGE